MPQFIENDATALAVYIASLSGGLVAFDGRPAAGKAPLARDMALRLGCTAVDGDDFLVRDREVFVDALRFDDLRRAIEAAKPPVLLSSVCARQVIERLGLVAAAFIWVETASLVRLKQIRRDFYDGIEERAPRGVSKLLDEVEAYVAAYNARGRPDVVYLNAYGDE
jgi:hypothetical protein